MPSKKKVVVEETVETKSEPEPEPEKPKRTRVMTEEALEKLKKARELALKARQQKAAYEAEHREIKETWGQKVNQVEAFQTLKKKAKEEADEEVKKNEIVTINKRLEDLYGKFEGYLQDKAVRRQQKEQARQEKKASEIARELPAAMSQRMLEQQLKDFEVARWRKQYLGF